MTSRPVYVKAKWTKEPAPSLSKKRKASSTKQATRSKKSKPETLKKRYAELQGSLAVVTGVVETLDSALSAFRILDNHPTWENLLAQVRDLGAEYQQVCEPEQDLAVCRSILFSSPAAALTVALGEAPSTVAGDQTKLATARASAFDTREKFQKLCDRLVQFWRTGGETPSAADVPDVPDVPDGLEPMEPSDPTPLAGWETCVICLDESPESTLVRVCDTCSCGWMCYGCFSGWVGALDTPNQRRVLFPDGTRSAQLIENEEEDSRAKNMPCPTCRQNISHLDAKRRSLAGPAPDPTDAWICSGCGVRLVVDPVLGRRTWPEHVAQCQSAQTTCRLGSCRIVCGVGADENALGTPSEAGRWVDHACGNTCRSYYCATETCCSAMTLPEFKVHEKAHQVLGFLFESMVVLVQKLLEVAHRLLRPQSILDAAKPTDKWHGVETKAIRLIEILGGCNQRWGCTPAVKPDAYATGERQLWNVCDTRLQASPVQNGSDHLAEWLRLARRSGGRVEINRPVVFFALPTNERELGFVTQTRRILPRPPRILARWGN